MKKESLNYFSESEKGSVKRFEGYRTKILLPICRLLSKAGITADAISYVGFFSLAGFIYYVESNPLLACLFIFIHVILDGLDGPLSRYCGTDGDSGALTDILVDHTGMIVVVLTLIFFGLVNPFWAALYMFLYTLMIIFVIVRNKLGIPIKYVVRSKYFLYLVYLYWAITGTNVLSEAIIIFTILMIPEILISYFKIKKVLK